MLPATIIIINSSQSIIYNAKYIGQALDDLCWNILPAKAGPNGSLLCICIFPFDMKK